MKLETKFELGDKVLLLQNNQIAYATVKGFKINVNTTGKVTIKNYFTENIQIDENKCFKSKQELIDSLL